MVTEFSAIQCTLEKTSSDNDVTLSVDQMTKVIDNKLISLPEQLNLNTLLQMEFSYYVVIINDNPNKYLSDAEISINPISNSKI